MEIIEQIWERQNLNLISYGISISHEDTIDDFDSEIKKIDCDYLMVTVPPNKMDITYSLQDRGFKFAETLFSLRANLREVVLPKTLEKPYSCISCNRSNDDDLTLIYSKIINGMFNTDRYSLDPKIGIEKSSNRYYEWAKSEINSGDSYVYTVQHDEARIGFFVIKTPQDKTVATSLLAGLFNNRESFGLGFSVLYSPMVVARDMGYKQIQTRVSSNNLASLRMHLSLGYTIKKLDYIFIKHNS